MIEVETAMWTLARTELWLVPLVTLVAACSAAVQGRIAIDAPSGSEAAFAPVGDYLDHRCGTLDCHGQLDRNLRIWGCEGLRLGPGSVPGCTQTPTTPDEHAATYRSLVSLEPATMSEVVHGHAADPELLTFVRKARGTETHKGGELVVPGDVQDTCIVSWLAGRTDDAACTLALAYPMFPSADAGAGPDAGNTLMP